MFGKHAISRQSQTDRRREREREDCSAQTGPTCKVVVPVQWVSYHTQGFIYTYDNTTYLPTVAYIIPSYKRWLSINEPSHRLSLETKFL